MSETYYKAGKIVRQSFLLLFALVFLEIIAGQFINTQFINTDDKILSLPALLMLIPVVNGVGGNIGSILGARLTSGLHVGYIEPKYNDKNLRKNILLALALGGSVFAIMGVIIYVITPILHLDVEFSLWKLLVIFIGSGLMQIIVLCCICVFSALIAYRKGLDPDNIVTPIVTTFGDFIGISSILAISLIVGIY